MNYEEKDLSAQFGVPCIAAEPETLTNFLNGMQIVIIIFHEFSQASRCAWTTKIGFSNLSSRENARALMGPTCPPYNRASHCASEGTKKCRIKGRSDQTSQQNLKFASTCSGSCTSMDGAGKRKSLRRATESPTAIVFISLELMHTVLPSTAS